MNPKAPIVFVHGFMGEAIPAWTAFQYLLPLRARAKHYDLFFYGYNCVTGNTMAQGRLFCDFLDKLWTSPESVAKDSLPTTAGRKSNFRYKKVVLVGHSIGAIVCRRALLFARDLGHNWMSNTSMILFAPAHRGARGKALLKDLGTWPWLKLVVTTLRYASPLLDEVAPDSQSIAELQRDSSDAIKKGARYLVAKKVIIAEVERVIDNLRFVQDPVPVAIPGTTHNRLQTAFWLYPAH